MSDFVEQLTDLEKRLVQERTELLTVMANRSQPSPLAADELRRLADLHAVIVAVKAELADRLPREGHSRWS